jgi:IclR family acetate operon transcriptional repressor
VLRECEVVSLVSAESKQTLRTPVTVGSRTPAHCTSLGKAILAFSTDDQVAAFLKGRMLKPYTPKTIITGSRFRENLCATRQRGYAFDDEEREPGLRCIGAPVWNSNAEVSAAVSVAGPTFRITDERVPVLAAAVMRCAGRISAALGYRAGTKLKQAHA